QESRGQVGFDDLVPEIERHLVDGGAVGDARIVDRHIDGAESLDSPIEQVLYRRLVGHVGGDTEGLAAEALNLCHERLEPFGAACREHHLGALVRERDSAGLTDSGTGTGHEDDPPLQYAHRTSLRLTLSGGLNQPGAEAKPSNRRGGWWTH